VSGTHARPTEAASELTDPPEGPGTGVAAVEALARILDPFAFEAPGIRRDVGKELHRADRRLHAVLCATRAVAAGYRQICDDPNTVNRVAKAMRDAEALAHNTPTMTLVPWHQLDARNKRWYRAKARAAIRALAGYRLVPEEPGS
jgi:hypothetical protein